MPSGPGGVASSGFEGWRPLKSEDRANYDWMHEMLYEARHVAVMQPSCNRNARDVLRGAPCSRHATVM